MKKLLSTLSLLIIFSTLSNAQEVSSKRNFSYVELGGTGLFFSVNYERQISKEPGFSWRFGIGGYSDGDFYATYSTGFAYLFSLNDEESSFIEFGANYTIARKYVGLTGEERNPDIFENIIPGVSYRKHFENDTMLKAGVNAIANRYGISPWLNIGFGKRF